MKVEVEIRTAFRTVSPFIIHRRAPELVEFLKRTFDAEELQRRTDEEAYGFYAEVRIGSSRLMLGGGSAAELGNVPGAFHVYVDDCDATYPENRSGIPSGGFFVRVDDVQVAYARALDAGATVVRPPADIPYGYQSAIVKDLEGFMWWTARLMMR